MSPPDVAELIAAARKAATGAYAPYSNIRFGCAVLFEGDDTIYTGANVETAAYGSTICSERVAICAAVAQRKRNGQSLKLTHVAIARVDEHGDPIPASSPCGACLQVMAEFGNSDTALLIDQLKDPRYNYSLSLSDFLPLPFNWPSLEPPPF